jgi:hypothetical protein
MSQVPNSASHVARPELAVGGKLTYMNPLVMTRRACIFRRSQSAAPREFIDTIRGNRSATKFKRPAAKLLGWLEFRIGPYVISLNRA